MDLLAIAIISAGVAALTLVSGFGLGTLLMPAFAFFFPLPIAIAATGVVHFANNVFKLAIVGKHANRQVVLRFGLPAVGAALVGAALMTQVAESPPLAQYAATTPLGVLSGEVTWLKMLTAALLAGFAALELSPAYQRLSFPRAALPIGGVLSGFFGGVSGMQGALRAPFLLRAGLERDAYVGTANVISTIVDVARLAVYAAGLFAVTRQTSSSVPGSSPGTSSQFAWDAHSISLVAVACIAAFAGVLLANRFLKKLTLRSVRFLVAGLLFLLAAGLGSGVL
ncbi:MAG: TSUP family transporter [Planctomycetota bacterium]|nr:TSUP family transporter [Planctomycetota bacterium]